MIPELCLTQDVTRKCFMLDVYPPGCTATLWREHFGYHSSTNLCNCITFGLQVHLPVAPIDTTQTAIRRTLFEFSAKQNLLMVS